MRSQSTCHAEVCQPGEIEVKAPGQQFLLTMVTKEIVTLLCRKLLVQKSWISNTKMITACCVNWYGQNNSACPFE